MGTVAQKTLVGHTKSRTARERSRQNTLAPHSAASVPDRVEKSTQTVPSSLSTMMDSDVSMLGFQLSLYLFEIATIGATHNMIKVVIS